MKTIAKIFIISTFLIHSAFAQKFITKTGHIRFYSDAPMEKIEANNNQVNSAIDFSTGDFIFKVLMKSFEFQKALMQEHFNENYAESNKFPNASFKGKITNLKDVNLSKDGIYNVNVEGDLTLHGVTKQVKTVGTLEVKSGKIIGKSKFYINLSDYDIKIPNTVVNNISNKVEITVDITLDKLNK